MRTEDITKNHGASIVQLIRAKYQDNLEFCQWLKAFFDQSGVHRPDYDAAAVRAKGKGGKKSGAFFAKSAAGYNSKPLPTATRRAAPVTTTTKPLRERPTGGQTNKPTKGQNAAQVEADAKLIKENETLTATVQEIERERDFYFQKLRDIEVMMQVHQEKGEEGDPDTLIEKVFKVLYATAEDGLVVTDDGEILDKAEQELEDALFVQEE